VHVWSKKLESEKKAVEQCIFLINGVIFLVSGIKAQKITSHADQQIIAIGQGMFGE
jgi:hypothetical protein